MQFQSGEIDGLGIRRVEKHSDERGWLAELFRADELDRDGMPAMGYISVTRPGAGRGPHEHREQTDQFCFLGPGRFEVRLWDNRPESPTFQNLMTVVAGDAEPKLITVPPGVVHGYKNIGQQDAVVINLPNRLYRGRGRDEAVDEIRHETGRGSPFQLD